MAVSEGYLELRDVYSDTRKEQFDIMTPELLSILQDRIISCRGQLMFKLGVADGWRHLLSIESIKILAQITTKLDSKGKLTVPVSYKEAAKPYIGRIEQLQWPFVVLTGVAICSNGLRWGMNWREDTKRVELKTAPTTEEQYCINSINIRALKLSGPYAIGDPITAQIDSEVLESDCFTYIENMYGANALRYLYLRGMSLVDDNAREAKLIAIMGSSGIGKSPEILLWQNTLGPANYSVNSFDTLTDKFAPQTTENIKKCVFFGDVRFSEELNLGYLRRQFSSDAVDIGDGVSTVINAVGVMMCNELPVLTNEQLRNHITEMNIKRFEVVRTITTKQKLEGDRSRTFLHNEMFITVLAHLSVYVYMRDRGKNKRNLLSFVSTLFLGRDYEFWQLVRLMSADDVEDMYYVMGLTDKYDPPSKRGLDPDRPFTYDSKDPCFSIIESHTFLAWSLLSENFGVPLALLSNIILKNYCVDDRILCYHSVWLIPGIILRDDAQIFPSYITDEERAAMLKQMQSDNVKRLMKSRERERFREFDNKQRLAVEINLFGDLSTGVPPVSVESADQQSTIEPLQSESTDPDDNFVQQIIAFSGNNADDDDWDFDYE